jgi:hypothetical protein
MKYCQETARETPVTHEFDVIVCGAGPAGVSAAVAAARNGAKTGLIEVKGCLGGIWTAGLLAWIIDHENKTGFMQELREDILARQAGEIAPYSSSLAFDVEEMKSLLEEKCLEAGVHVRLHTRVVAAQTDGDRRLTHVITESKSGREAWKANVFIDATGDGDLGAAAGCEFELGQPDSGRTQPMSLLCLLTGINLEQVADVVNGHCQDWGPSKARLKAEMNRGGADPSYALPTLFHLADDLYMLMANHQYNVLAIDADEVTRATLTARAEIHQQVRALRSLGGRWKNLRVVATGEQIGTREGRRLAGRYRLTREDLIAGAKFEDAVCTCTFGIDVHSPDPDKCKGIASSGKYRTQPYDIPLRALISKDFDNLMMAGRCISGDFLAHSSYRVIGDAVPMGEAAGQTAAKGLP